LTFQLSPVNWLSSSESGKTDQRKDKSMGQWISIGNDSNILVFVGGADGFVDGGHSRYGAPVISQMICCNATWQRVLAER